MKLCDYFKMILRLKFESSNAKFFRELFDNFIRTPYKNEVDTDIEFNPIEKYYDNDETLRSICNGATNLSRACASELYNLYDKDKCSGFFIERCDNFDDFKEIMIDYGFEIEIEDGDEDIVGTMADLLAKIVKDISIGNRESFPPLNKIAAKSLNKDAFKDAYIKDNCMYIEGHCIKLPFTIEDVASNNEDLPYVRELFKIYSERLGKPITSIKELISHKEFISHFNRQRRSYLSAEAIKRSVRDIFIDGEEHFDMIEGEVWSAIIESYYDLDVKDGYRRINNVLNMAIKANLNSTILLNIKGFITSEERKGICHILVNEGIIRSWVEVEYE